MLFFLMASPVRALYSIEHPATVRRNPTIEREHIIKIMRRLFSTFYRIILTTASISAVILSILAATSCDFLDFVHPYYEADGRSLTILRNLQDSDVTGQTDALSEDFISPTPPAVGLVNTDYLAQLADSISQVGNLTEGTDVGADGASSQAAGVIAAAVNSTVEEVIIPADIVGVSEDSNESEAAGLVNSSEGSGASTAVENVPPGNDVETSPNEVENKSDIDSSTTSKESAIPAQTSTSMTEVESDINTTNPITQGGVSENTGVYNKTDFVTDDFVTNIPANVYGQNTSDIPSVAMSGSAGLFCSANDVSIFNIWKGTFLNSELAIDEESEHDESEDIARNGAIVSIIFGVLIASILVVETIFGWKMCCEKWIVGFLALFACVSQGVTFLFFNSERYW